MRIELNDAWDGIPLDCVDECISFLHARLGQGHPLLQHKFFPLAKKWRQHQYIIEHDDDADLVWFLDLTKKRRIKGKMLYAFKQLNTEEEIQSMLDKDYEAWVEYMKSAGAWDE